MTILLPQMSEAVKLESDGNIDNTEAGLFKKMDPDTCSDLCWSVPCEVRQALTQEGRGPCINIFVGGLIPTKRDILVGG